jgi:hypothetical protein
VLSAQELDMGSARRFATGNESLSIALCWKYFVQPLGSVLAIGIFGF